MAGILSATKTNKALFLAIAVSVCASSVAMASTVNTVTFDGIKTDANEYTGGVANGSENLQWFNDHESKKYGYGDNVSNSLLWEVNLLDAPKDGNSYSLNLFFEVPTDARRMIWEGEKIDKKSSSGGCFWESGGVGDSGGCSKILALDKGEEILDAYAEGSHHKDGSSGGLSVKMDYETQTGSELFNLGTNPKFDDDGKFDGFDTSLFGEKKWTAASDTDQTDDGSWATSLEYLFLNDICDKALCLEWDRSFSVELLFLFGTEAEAIAKAGTLGNYVMRLHLSDEANGINEITTTPVPLPAALPMLFAGLGALGFVGRRRRSSKKAT